MHAITVDPRECTRWHYADRSLFEFGDIPALAEDIKRNGQIEPVLIRNSSNSNYQYEIIAGSRRWKACLDSGLQLKAILLNASDEEAAIIQIKENQALEICDYSKGIYYAKLLDDQKITQEKLAKNINCSRQKLQNYLSFTKIPQSIWDAVSNMSKVSSRTAAAIYALSQKGCDVVSILINLAEEIRKGIGATRLENMVNQLLLDKDPEVFKTSPISLPSGAKIGIWKNNTLKFSKEININQDKFLKHVVKYFQNEI